MFWVAFLVLKTLTYAAPCRVRSPWVVLNSIHANFTSNNILVIFDFQGLPYFIGILPYLGDIKLTDIKDRLYNYATVNKWTYPLPITRNFKQNTVAVFTAKFTPDQREKQFYILFDSRIEKLAPQKKAKQKKPKKNRKSKKTRRHKRRKKRSISMKNLTGLENLKPNQHIITHLRP